MRRFWPEEWPAKRRLKVNPEKWLLVRRISDEPYKIEPFLADIDQVMMFERTMPDNFINEAGNGVTEEFLRWCRPLIGEALPDMISFNRLSGRKEGK